MIIDIAEIVRVQRSRVLASLARTLGDLDLAEDAVQDASIAALEVWPRVGVPSNPAGWLTVAARRKAIDVLRRESRRDDKEVLVTRLEAEEREAHLIDDDLLRMLFVCCHPAIELEARAALALRTLGGLTTEEVAQIFLVSPSTMAKRLTRTKRKIADAGIPFEVPREDQLVARVNSVVTVIHLIYTSGHRGTGDELVRVDLCDEAIRLARLLNELLPGDSTVEAVLSQLLTTDARRATRLDGDGEIVLLTDQDRSQWDQGNIQEGLALLHRSVARTNGSANSFQLQAAISACHVSAPTYDDTEWVEILRLYRLLMEINPSPVVLLNMAVALAEVEGADAALALIEGLEIDIFRLESVRGELLTRLGRAGEAQDAYVEAIAAAGDGNVSPAEVRLLRRKANLAE